MAQRKYVKIVTDPSYIHWAMSTSAQIFSVAHEGDVFELVREYIYAPSGDIISAVPPIPCDYCYWAQIIFPRYPDLRLYVCLREFGRHDPLAEIVEIKET